MSDIISTQLLKIIKTILDKYWYLQFLKLFNISVVFLYFIYILVLYKSIGCDLS